jgi:sn-glycerol 3-phosphate transport system substrate-binding protein
VTIEYWYPYTPPVGTAVEAAVASFNKQWAGQITVKAVFQGTFDQQLAKIRAAAAGGGLPQVATVRESDVSQFDQSGLVVQLDDHVKDVRTGLTSQQLADIYPGVLGRTKLAIWGNKTLAWPCCNTALAWFYNADLLQKAGIGTPPTTWEELLAAAPKIKAATGQPTIDLRQNQAGPIFITTLWTYGIPWLKPDGRSTNFDQPAALEILKWWRQMVDDGTMVMAATAENDFPNGRGAMLPASSGNIARFSNDIKTFKWGVMQIPNKSGQQPVTEMFGAVNTVLKSDKDKQLASWLFVKHMAASETQAQFAADAGYFPSTKSSATSAPIAAAAQKIPQYKDAVERISPHMQLLPQHANLGQIRNTIATDVVTAVLLKQLSPEDGIKKLIADANKALQQ